MFIFSKRLDISEATDRIAACSSVFFTEDFPAALAVLGQRLELPFEVGRVRVNQERSAITDEQGTYPIEVGTLRRLEQGGIARVGSTQSA